MKWGGGYRQVFLPPPCVVKNLIFSRFLLMKASLNYLATLEATPNSYCTVGAKLWVYRLLLFNSNLVLFLVFSLPHTLVPNAMTGVQ